MPNGIIEGPSPDKGTAFTNPVPIGLRYLATLPTLTDRQIYTLMGDTDGGLYICGADRATKLLRTEEQSPENQITSDTIQIYNAYAMDYTVTATGKVIAAIQEEWLNSYGGGELMVKLTSNGASVPALAIIEIMTSSSGITTAAEYTTVSCTSLSFRTNSITKTVFFHLPIGRFYLSILPIGAVSAGVNKFTVTAELLNRGLMS